MGRSLGSWADRWGQSFCCFSRKKTEALTPVTLLVHFRRRDPSHATRVPRPLRPRQRLAWVTGPWVTGRSLAGRSLGSELLFFLPEEDRSSDPGHATRAPSPPRSP